MKRFISFCVIISFLAIPFLAFAGPEIDRFSFNPRGGSKMSWDLLDTFSTALPAGSVNGTLSDSGHARTVVDTESKLSITGGKLSFSGGKASPAYFDPRIQYPAITRTAGMMGFFSVVPQAAITHFRFGFATTPASNSYADAIYYLSNGVGNARKNTDDSGMSVSGYTNSVTYLSSVILRANGYFLLDKDSGSVWKLLYTWPTGNTASLYPTVFNYSTTNASSYIGIPSTRWLPTPLLAHGFASVVTPSDGTGHAETTGLGSGGSGVTMTGATWSISSAKAVNTPGLGSELNSGALEVGKWYQITASEADHFYVGSAANDTFRATATTGLDANNKVKLITLADLFLTSPLSTSNVVASADLTITAKQRNGIALRLDSASNPTKGVVATFDGVTCKLTEFTTATTWTDRISAACTYSAGATLISITDGVNGRLYYNNALVGTTAAIDAGITGTIHGLFSTSPNSSADNLVIYPRGNEGQYSNLDAYVVQ